MTNFVGVVASSLVPDCYYGAILELNCLPGDNGTLECDHARFVSKLSGSIISCVYS